MVVVVVGPDEQQKPLLRKRGVGLLYVTLACSSNHTFSRFPTLYPLTGSGMTHRLKVSTTQSKLLASRGSCVASACTKLMGLPGNWRDTRARACRVRSTCQHNIRGVRANVHTRSCPGGTECQQP